MHTVNTHRFIDAILFPFIHSILSHTKKSFPFWALIAHLFECANMQQNCTHKMNNSHSGKKKIQPTVIEWIITLSSFCYSQNLFTFFSHALFTRQKGQAFGSNLCRSVNGVLDCIKTNKHCYRKHDNKIIEKNSGFSFCQKWKSVAPLFSLLLSFRSLLNETIFIYRCHRPWNHLHWLLKSILKIFNSPLFHSPCVCFSFSFQNASLWITFGLCFICHSFTLFSYFETKKTINTKSPSMRYNCQP